MNIEIINIIVQVDGAVKAICNRLSVADLSDRASKDLGEHNQFIIDYFVDGNDYRDDYSHYFFSNFLIKLLFPAEQCVKLLEHVCQRETLAVFHAGGLNAMLNLVTKHSVNIHKVTIANNILSSN